MTKYKCPECKAVDTGDNWDNATKNFCEDVEIFLIENSASDGEFGVFHICPNCENQIDNEKIERIEEVEDKCEYCEIEFENKHNNGYNFEDAKFCRMCGRKL